MTEIKLNRFCNIFKLKFWILPTVFALAFCALRLLETGDSKDLFFPGFLCCTEFEAKKHVDKIEPQKIHTITGIRQFSKMRPLLEREIKK